MSLPEKGMSCRVDRIPRSTAYLGRERARPRDRTCERLMMEFRVAWATKFNISTWWQGRRSEKLVQNGRADECVWPLHGMGGQTSLYLLTSFDPS